jgi:hypothetical protein
MNLLGDNIDSIKNSGLLIDALEEVGLEVNAEKTKYMLLSGHQNAGKNHDIKIGSGSFANVIQFKYMGVTVTNQNCICGGIKSRLNSRNACYRSNQNLLSSHLLSRNVKMRIYKTAVLPVALHGCQTSSLALRKEQRLRVFENRMLRRLFRPTSGEVAGGWRKLHNEELHHLYSSPNVNRIMNSRRMKWAEHVAHMRMRTNASYRILVGKTTRKTKT